MSHDALAGLLRGFHLPTMADIYADTLQQAEQNHWGYRKFLQHLCESEAEDRRQRRIARLLKQSGLPAGKRRWRESRCPSAPRWRRSGRQICCLGNANPGAV